MMNQDSAFLGLKMRNLGNRKRRIFLFLFILGIIFLGIYYLGSRIQTEAIIFFIRRAGIWASVVFIILTASTYVIAPLSGTPLWFAGYVIFGSKFQIYTYLAAILAAGINFWIARKWGRGLVMRLVDRKNIEKVDGFTKDYGIKSLILLRLFVGSFHDFISYAYGLTNMRFLSYIIISALMGIPWLLLWQLYLFERIVNFEEFVIWSGITFIPLLIVSAIFLRKLGKRGNS